MLPVFSPAGGTMLQTKPDLSCLGAAFSLAAIREYTPSTWLYPLALTFSNGGVWLFLLARRRALAAPALI